jgi:hypothetical protein
MGNKCHFDSHYRSHAGISAIRPPATSSDRNPFALATLIKLLLDCPERIWREIEREDFLSAARLEGIGRVVYHELLGTATHSADDGDDVDIMVCLYRCELAFKRVLMSETRLHSP